MCVCVCVCVCVTACVLCVCMSMCACVYISRILYECVVETFLKTSGSIVAIQLFKLIYCYVEMTLFWK